ncbi:MAG: 50S ribosomal protein L16 [Thaumarchaeota archaeon]|nr:MAG: 50S ribosomal protein L16 [Nitrososphaerota archaeon]
MKAKNWRAPERPYTRADYIAGAPQPRIAKYNMGKYSDDYQYELLLVAKEDMQIRDVSLESARIALTKHLSSVLGSEGFYAELKAHPHHVLRENKMIFGAHADRLQEGMRRAFGKPVGRAARVLKGSPVFRVLVNEEGLQAAKRALDLASKKLPKSYRIVIRRLEKKAA